MVAEGRVAQVSVEACPEALAGQLLGLIWEEVQEEMPPQQLLVRFGILGVPSFQEVALALAPWLVSTAVAWAT